MNQTCETFSGRQGYLVWNFLVSEAIRVGLYLECYFLYGVLYCGVELVLQDYRLYYNLYSPYQFTRTNSFSGQESSSSSACVHQKTEKMKPFQRVILNNIPDSSYLNSVNSISRTLNDSAQVSSFSSLIFLCLSGFFRSTRQKSL